MGFKNSPEQNPVRIKVKNADGTVNIHCHRCGSFICRALFVGFHSVLCYYCETGTPRPQFLTPQEELLNQIYSDPEGTVEKAIEKEKRGPLLNILDMAVNTVRAIGFGRKKKEEIDKSQVEYAGVDQFSSKELAKKKKRIPIFKNKGKSSDK